jgi:hypothetical protein
MDVLALESACKEGLTYLLDATESEKLLPETQVEKPEQQPQPVKARITRACEASMADAVFFPAVRVVNSSGKVLGTLPECSRGEFHELQVLFPEDEKDFKVTIETGSVLGKVTRAEFIPSLYRLKPAVPIAMGYFNVTPVADAKQPLNWRLFTTREGVPMGAQAIRIFKLDLTESQTPEMKRP